MKIRTRRVTRSAVVLVLAAGSVTAVGDIAVSAASSPKKAVQAYLAYESALVLDETNPNAAKVASRPKVTQGAKSVTRARFARKIDERVANQVADVHYRSVSTKVTVQKQQVRGSRATLTVVEQTTYKPTDGSPDYSYASRHRFSLVAARGAWSVSAVDTLDPGSPLSAKRLAASTEEVTALGRRTEIRSQVKALSTSVTKSAARLRASDKAKLAGQPLSVTGKQASAEMSATATGSGASLAPRAALARPDVLPANPTMSAQVNGSGPPYDYTAMKDWALKYAKDTPVTYTRDTNDCTTFVSWALWKGGWAETGAQDYPSVAWNHDDYNVWYWRSNDGNPRHSYTWGGAYNWQVFAYSESKRVRALSYLSDLLIADVMQMDINGYGRASGPDHTMIVTGRNSSGQPLLSYHSTDTKNKPLSSVISGQDGPYWALRT